MNRYKRLILMEKAESDTKELRYLMTVINNRLESMTSDDFNLLSIDGELWLTVALQLREASRIASTISKELIEMEDEARRDDGN